jgi:hypothetical protein
MSNIITFNEMESMASYIVRSKLFGAKDESQAMSLMLLAQAEGLHPMTAVQDFDIVQGRPARKTHSILARFQAAGGSVAWEEISSTRACGTFSHKQGGALRVEWTFEQAKKAGLTGKDNWRNYPQAMLRARCIAEGVRAVFPGAIGGMLTVEEAQDVEPAPQPMKDINAAPTQHIVTADWLAAVESCSSTEGLALTWKEGVADIQKANDKPLYDRFKAAVARRKAELVAAEQPAPESVPDADFVAGMDAGEANG